MSRIHWLSRFLVVGNFVIGQNRFASVLNGDFIVPQWLFDGILSNFCPIRATEALFNPSWQAFSKGDLYVTWWWPLSLVKNRSAIVQIWEIAGDWGVLFCRWAGLTWANVVALDGVSRLDATFGSICTRADPAESASKSFCKRSEWRFHLSAMVNKVYRAHSWSILRSTRCCFLLIPFARSIERRVSDLFQVWVNFLELFCFWSAVGAAVAASRFGCTMCIVNHHNEAYSSLYDYWTR